MTTAISSKGQIVLPVGLRRKDGLEAGQVFVIERVKAGQYSLRRVAKPAGGGTLDWLRACPADGWFRPIPSESTDAL